MQPEQTAAGTYQPRIVVVGAPASEVRAAAMFLVGLADGFPLPTVLLVSGQGEGGGDDDVGVTLQAHCALPVRQIDDKDPILPGRVHVAPPGYHLLVEAGHFVLSTEAPVNGARPSMDVLLESAAETFGGAVVCALLGSDDPALWPRDGHLGAERVRACGGLVIVQNPSTAAVSDGEHPEPVAAALRAGTMLHLSEIGPFVSRLGEAEIS
jgi:two-component system chemotaxis response regulator CheB